MTPRNDLRASTTSPADPSAPAGRGDGADRTDAAEDERPSGADPVGRVLAGERPLTARSVVASVLLGTHPPRMAPRNLVRVGERFGLAEGTVRTAISRMAAAGELEQDDRGRYALAGALLERQARQDESRAAATRAWDGAWTTAVVLADRRSAADRGRLRSAAHVLRLAEVREGTWLRPDNLEGGARTAAAAAVLAEQCERFRSWPVGDPVALAARLWDLDAWSRRADDLIAAMGPVLERVRAGDADAVAPGFVLAAAVLRHAQADPLLPAELLPPAWPGDRLRAAYDDYDAAYRHLLATEVLTDPTR